MKKKIVFMLIIMYIFCLPLPRSVHIISHKKLQYRQVNDTVRRTPKIAIRQAEAHNIIDDYTPFIQVLYEVKNPHIQEEYRHVVVKPKFRPQSARIMVEESFQNLYLQKQNICSIIRTRNFVSC